MKHIYEIEKTVQGEQYSRKRIGWELERTAMGDGFYGNALQVAKDFPELSDEDRSVLDRYATGAQQHTDHITLQVIAMKIYPNEMTEETMNLVNGETLLAMKKGEEITAPGAQLDYWLIGDYNAQDNPYYFYEGATWHINCEGLSEAEDLSDVKARIVELQAMGVKEIIFPATDTDPEVRVNLADYPQTVTFTRN